MLDDDPTGAQEATGVPVLLQRDKTALVELLRRHEAVYILTNTRALTQRESTELLRTLRCDLRDAAIALEADIRIVQRGDSTLRGHIFPEMDVFAGPDVLVIFAPAYPAGGRVTADGVHRVQIDGRWVNAADTEFAGDPVFGYSSRTLVEFVADKGNRRAVSVSRGELLRAALAEPPGTVLIPDACTDADLKAIADDIKRLRDDGHEIVVRSAAPLAAFLADHKSTSFIDVAPAPIDGPVLIVAGSHTEATSRQIRTLLDRSDVCTLELSTDSAIDDAPSAGARLADAARTALHQDRVVLMHTRRVRKPEHNTLDAAAQVMRALVTAVRAVRGLPGAVIAKGGITSAEVARAGFGARTAWVQGQVEPGISLWRLGDPARDVPYLVVPGNLGDDHTLARLTGKLVNR